jgi:hypothetical protein
MVRPAGVGPFTRLRPRQPLTSKHSSSMDRRQSAGELGNYAVGRRECRHWHNFFLGNSDSNVITIDTFITDVGFSNADADNSFMLIID